MRLTVICLLFAVSAGLSVAATDVGVDSILFERYYPPGDSFEPVAAWHNFGDSAAAFTAWFGLADPESSLVYVDSVTVLSLGPSAETTLAFRPHLLDMAGRWVARCSTAAAGDTNPANDTLVRDFWVNYG